MQTVRLVKSKSNGPYFLLATGSKWMSWFVCLLSPHALSPTTVLLSPTYTTIAMCLVFPAYSTIGCDFAIQAHEALSCVWGLPVSPLKVSPAYPGRGGDWSRCCFHSVLLSRVVEHCLRRGKTIEAERWAWLEQRSKERRGLWSFWGRSTMNVVPIVVGE